MDLQRIGNYEVLGELGRGGMGVVYRGVDSFIKRQVAIKTIYLTEIQEDHERQFLRERLYREAQSAGILSHPNIVTIYQIGEQDDITYIVMEFVEGKNLAQLLRSPEKPTVEALLSIFDQTAAALDHAHGMGVIHRDIKPANIIVRSDGVAKITDFGVAKIASQTVTRTGMTLGTPHFMAPEQIQGKPIDGRADQYALGVVIYEIFTGRKPFTADSMTTLIFRIVSDAVDPKRDNPNLSDAASEVLKRALAKEASQRYASCQELVEAFRNAIGMPSAGVYGYSGSSTIPSGSGVLAGHTPTGTQPLAKRQLPTQTGVPQSSSVLHSPGTGVQTPTPTPVIPTPPSAHVSATPAPPMAPAPQTAAHGVSGNPPTRAPVPPQVPRGQGTQGQSGHDLAGRGAQPPIQNSGTGVYAGSATTTFDQRPKKNTWLVPTLIGAGLVAVIGIFALVQLFRAASEGGDSKIASTQGAGSTAVSGSPSTPDASSSPVTPTSAGAVRNPGSTASPATRPNETKPVSAPPQRPAQSASSNGSGSGAPPSRPNTSAGNTPSGGISSPAKPAVTPSAQGSGTSRVPASTYGGTPANPGSRPPTPTPTKVPVTTTPEPPRHETPSQPVFTPPKPIVRVPAIYPAQARRDGVSGAVLLQAVVNETGQPTAVNVIRGIRADLDEAAQAALSKWRFQPGTADGKPVESRVNVEISFNLVQDQRKPISLKNP